MSTSNGTVSNGNGTDKDVAEDATDATASTAQEPKSTAVETVGAAPEHGFLYRLYTGTGAVDVVGKRTLWFGISGAFMVVAILSIAIKGFVFGIDFEGGTKVWFPKGDATVQQTEDVFSQTLGHDAESIVVTGTGDSASIQIRTEKLDNEQSSKLHKALFDRFAPKGPDGKPSIDAISDSDVSETWGSQITNKALWALGVFLVLAGIYIAVRYERYMSLAALAALVFDLLVTAGVYSLVGFEVTPATVIGLLTILGFSLYDTVIVFDKVEENTHGFQHTSRRTYAEHANLAVNQTFMRSINTSLISAIPVLSLIVVAIWLLGVGTLKDLALVQLVGILVGTYSSIFFATPLLVALRERTDLVASHTKKVLSRRKPDAAPLADAGVGSKTAKTATSGTSDAAASGVRPAKPKPGARPQGKRNTRRH
ncbi:Probable protein-export membrane protein SecF [Mycobacteroides abscessus subsp. bolletii]|uniref:Protein-export membrane protein SecF n=1 Tax=Mycobacteroides abscessus subsp. bolletii TaxID=319705 RepID=A0A9Q7SEI4_9MYCO|nr:preprotein translocase subunit SecF [Mycobacteroides abscessus]SHP11114.1 Probable protein-export membrane protein SecF [Mycobacteroides abscessus subsp. bolletii]SKV19608.1 Probable protein-export membrane protein SecF [Mycobacteroides abscessus subsp. massiliense]CPS10931.1 Probable protein-export membrane protein SecF [Mycobacteroides abscessus]CPS27085.1 Probable protein-export membrane protein SecF [Mycobacteroides abscessus]